MVSNIRLDRYNQTARPFNWTFTVSDLRELMARIGQHQQQARAGPHHVGKLSALGFEVTLARLPGTGTDPDATRNQAA